MILDRRKAEGEDTSWPGFRLRGSEVTRLESFSDAVFGFAITLLVVSLDVPRTFKELFAVMRGFPAFAICFLFLALIWNAHYKFCRRFGLQDGWTRFLTCLLLFVVLFFVYPLKFLFNLSITSHFFGGPNGPAVTKASQYARLMVTYGLGFAAVYTAMLLLYARAYRLRDVLELSQLEKFDTRYQIYRLLILIGVGLLAAVVAGQRILLVWSGVVYMLIGLLMRIANALHRKQRRRVESRR
jgi:uncharacterized membrane protein